MTRRALVVSSFLPPVVGGVEFFVSWLQSELPSLGWDVQTVGCRGKGDLVWPCPGRDIANIPVALPAPRSFRRLRALTRQADIVLAQNFFYPLSHWALLAAKSEGVPIRTFIHGNVLCPDDASEIVRIGSRVHARTLGRWQLRNAGPVAISRSSRDFIAEEFGVDAPVIPLPIPDIPRAEQTTGPHGDEPARIIFVGRLVDLKGPIEALEAASILSRHRPVQLEFFGDGPLRDELERRAPDWVVVHGQRARQDVLRALSRAHCFLSASVTDNAQTSLLEAIVMGVPSVATAVGDAPDYLAGPMSRLCVPAYDIDGLAAALRTATDDWNRWSSLARVRGDELRARHATGAVLGQIEKLLGAADVSRRTNAA